MINGIFTLIPTPMAASVLWSAGIKALVLVLIIVCLVVLISWLITEFIWHKKNAIPSPTDDAEANLEAEAETQTETTEEQNTD